MSETTTASLKQEILEWAMKPGSPKNFTTHDVYEYIHSAETSRQTSEALRSMWKYDKTLDREEFMDGNKKRFIYSLKKGSNINNYEINYDKELVKLIQQKENKVNERLKDCFENKVNIDQELIDKAKQAGSNRAGFNSGAPRYPAKCDAIPELSGMSESPAYSAGSTAGKGIANTNNNQQIEIPNNFCIELKTPNGFMITIKAVDLMK